MTRPRTAACLAVASLALAACGEKEEDFTTTEEGPSGTEPPAGAILVGEFAFEPDAKTVKPGEEVTWFNSGEELHTVKGSGFASQAFGNGETYSFTFEKPGSYEYVCTIHPTQMRGTITVPAPPKKPAKKN